MNFLADEGVDKQIAERLRQEEHSVLYVAEMEPGICDETVLQRANQNTALLITEDKDFGELVFRQKLIHGGVILVKLMGVSSSTKTNTVMQIIEEHGPEILNAFTVISPGMVRIRKS